MRHLFLFGLVYAALQSTALAQDQRWYQIELLFFRNLSAASQFEEQWPTSIKLTLPALSYEIPDSSGADSGQVQHLQVYEAAAMEVGDWGGPPRTTAAVGSNASGPSPTLEYVGVAPGSGDLANARARLNQRRDFRVLGYQVWRQRLKSDARPLVFHVEAGDVYGTQAELEGTISISLKHYLHVDADLWWADYGDGAPPGQAVPEGTTQGGSMRVAHLKEDRRMRSAQTHYLDHPLIGALIRITPASGPGG